MAKFINLGVLSWQQFVATAARRVTEDSLPGAEDASTQVSDYRTNWTGCTSLQHAVDMASAGWPEGAQEIAATLDTLPPAQDILPDFQLDVVGSFPCVPAYCAGDPECMWKYEQERRATRRLTLVVPASYSAYVPPQDAMQYAKGVAAVCRAIEASGVDVAIWSVSSGVSDKGRGAECLYAVSVRELGEPLDLAKVAFAFYPAFLRRLSFAWREITDEAVLYGQARDGYARPNEIDVERARAVLGDACEDSAGVLCCLPSVNEMHHAGLCSRNSLPDLLAKFREKVEQDIAAAEKQR